MSAQARGWGPGWPHCQAGGVVKVVCGGDQLRLPVRSEIATLVPQLVHALEAARGAPFRPDWSWGFACRAIAGTSAPSNHSWGLAIDLDAPDNPMLVASAHRLRHPLRREFPGGRVLRSSMPIEAEAIASRFGFRWGGTYKTKPDPMHFEFMGSPDDARERSGHPPVGDTSGAVPPVADGGAGIRTYTVKSGDTLSEVGVRLGIRWQALAARNRVPGPKFIIHPGQVLFF